MKIDGPLPMHSKTKRLSDRAFGFTFAALFLAVFLIALVFGRRPSWPLALSSFFGLSALLVPGLLMPLNRTWMQIAERINRVLNAVLLAIAYVFVIMPLGVIMRLRGRDALRLKSGSVDATYWAPPARPITRENFEDQF